MMLGRYVTALYIQTDSTLAYQMVSTVGLQFSPSATSVCDAEDIAMWLAQRVDRVWTRDECGDGVCNSPLEFPAFGE